MGSNMSFGETKSQKEVITMTPITITGSFGLEQHTGGEGKLHGICGLRSESSVFGSDVGLLGDVMQT